MDTTKRVRVYRVVSAIVATTTLWAPALFAQKQFEGVVTYDSYTHGKPHTSTLSVKGDRLRAEGFDDAGRDEQSGVLIVNSKHELLSAMPERHFYVVINANFHLDKPTSLLTFTKTGQSESVAGYSCEHYVMSNPKSPGRDLDLCITTALGSVAIVPGQFFAGAEGQAQFRDGFLVLKSTDKKGNLLATATKVERRSMSDALFEPASDWKEVNSSGRLGRP